MDEISVKVEVEINPTESEDKVQRAVENIFGNVAMQTKPMRRGKLLIAESTGIEGLTKFYNLLRRERIRDASKKALFEGIDKNTLTFFLNKQVAYAGHVSFSKEVAESPLGPIKVTIRSENPRQVIDWLT